MNKNIEVENGELALENEFGDIVIVPKKYAREVRDMIKEDCNSCIDSLAETLPKMEDYAEDGTVIKGDDPDPKKKTLKRLSKSYFRPEVVAESTATSNREFKLPKKVKDKKEKHLNIVPTVATQELDEVVITTSKTANSRKKEIADKVALETTYQDTRYNQGIEENFDTPEDVKKIQQFLSDKGYDLDPNKRFKNKGIDGIAGKVTKNAVKKYNESINSPEFYQSIKDNEAKAPDDRGFLGLCKEEQCSEYVQNEIFRNVAKRNMNLSNSDRSKWNQDIGITGDAWDLGNNILRAGGKKVQQDMIKPGDVVGIHSGTQGELLEQAKRAGRNYTHAGIVDKVNPDGSYYVLHNWHKMEDGKYVGQEFRTLVNPKSGKLNGFPGNGVQEIYRPNYQGKLKPKVIAREDVKLKPRSAKIDNAFLQPINDHQTKSKFMGQYDVSETEYYSLSQAALGIMGQETKFGKDPRYASGLKKTAAKLSKHIGKTDLGNALDEVGIVDFKDNEVSLGPGSMKLQTNFNGAELSVFGINEDTIENPDKAVIATMQKLTNDYKYFKRKGYSKPDAIYRAIQKYNGSLNTVSGGKTREEWAKDYDLNYVNKVLNYANDFDIYVDKGKKAKTLIDELSTKEHVVKWAKEINN